MLLTGDTNRSALLRHYKGKLGSSCLNVIKILLFKMEWLSHIGRTSGLLVWWSEIGKQKQHPNDVIGS